MTPPQSVSSLFERLMTLAQEAFDARHYNTAYYLLAAALIEVEGDVQRCVAVERLAEQFLAWIDQFDPEYPHSTPSAAARGGQSIFTHLAMDAHAKLVLTQAQFLTAQPEHRETITLPPRPE
jgi:hypothetical protein